MNLIKKSLVLIAVLALGVAAASAGCGVKETAEGTLKSVDAKTQAVVVVDADGNEVKLTLTDKTKVMNAKGEKAEASALVGKKVKVVSEHAKVDSIQQTA